MKRLMLLPLFASIFLFIQCKQEKVTETEAPTLSAEESIKDFEIEKGFVVEAVCTEPLIEDPVALNFDEDANMWVVEMRGYMHDTEGGGEDQPLGRIKVIKDLNYDGKYDSAYVFLDSLIMPRTAVVVQSGILLIEPPGLFFIENNKGKAGKRILIDSAFAETGNVEHQPNGLFRSIDNWYYCASGDKRVKDINGKWLVEKTRSRGQWGMSQDDQGRLFYNNNSAVLLADNFLPGNFPINKNHRPVSGKISNAKVADNRVYPRRETSGVNRGYQKDVLDKEGRLVNVTSASGPVVYRGDNFPKEYYGNAFTMEPAAYLIKRVLLDEDKDGLLQGQFAYKDKEFLTATDERFRPVTAYNSPDGCLYFIDMHRGIIQHTTYMTPYLRKHIDSLKLERPIGMGRIYRIRWKENAASKPLKLSNYTTAQLVELLKHPNGFYRDIAQRLLVERNDLSAGEALLKLVVDKSDPKAALHSLWILDEMKLLNPPFLKIITMAHADNMSIYQSCLQLLGGSNEKAIALEIYLTLRKKGNRLAEVCFLNGLNAFQGKYNNRITPVAEEILSLFKNDPLVTDAFLSNAEGNEKNILKKLNESNKEDTVFLKALNAAIKRSEQPDENAAIAHLTNAEKQFYFSGKSIFANICATCHGKEGEGIPNLAPPLASSEWATADPDIPIKIVLDGLSGPVMVNGISYPVPANGMPGLRNNIETNNGDIAGVLTFIRNSFGNKASAITVEQVGKVRAATDNRMSSYTIEELKKN